LSEGHRRFSLAGKLALVASLQVAFTAVVAGVVAVFTARPALVFLASLLAGLLMALVSSQLFLASVSRTLQALTDGVRSFRDTDFSMRLAVTRQDELGDLVSLYNDMGDALRSERHDIYQRELLLDTVLQGAPMAIVLVSQAERVIYANRAARELLGGDRFAPGGHAALGRLLGHTLGEVLEQTPREMREALLGGSDALFTLPSGDSEETYRTARRVFHINMQRHTLYLLERLTPELRRREVEVWKKAIRVMNHELNNSLAPIRSLVHSARTVLAKPEHAHQLEGIFETLEERATYLTEFLEGYARFARLPLPRKQPVSWSEFLEGVQRLYAFTLDGLLPARKAAFDPTQMQQVLINLLKNAHEAGSPESEVRVAVLDTADGGWVIRVLDRGRGMGEEVMKRALLPFYSSKPSGTGLGLPLCNEILEAHGGRLRLESRAGGGTIVTCWLPAA
jgi:two-component system, NtrC family, nitrogen regulation sensor histidine kinase NtrY